MLRKKPKFFIIGVQKGGTTTLFNLLGQHPNIVLPKTKEIHFFDTNYTEGIKWYKNFFPKKSLTNIGKITGEATPYYIYHPLIAQRIKEHYPKAKFIILLRNPINRAFSQHNMITKRGIETLSFEDAINVEQSRLDGEVEKIKADINYYGNNHRHFSYLDRGVYHKQLKHWFSLFPREQFYIVQSEKFYSEPNLVTNEIFKFLGLGKYNLNKIKNYYEGEYNQPINTETYKSLEKFFRPNNEKLYKLLGEKYDW